MRISTVRTPSEHCSLQFLRRLQISNYTSEAGIEYCQEEVDYLVYLKQQRTGERLVTDYEREMRRQEQEQDMEVEMGVTSISEARAKKAKPSRHRYFCSECGWSTKDIDEASLTTDQYNTKSRKSEGFDSGRFACPECNTLLPESIFDGMVEIDKEGNITAKIPADIIYELEGRRFESDGNNIHFLHIGNAILNAVRHDLKIIYPHLAHILFPHGD